MLQRVALLLGQEARGIWGGTFHSTANRILRSYAGALGYTSSFSILGNQEDAASLIKAVMKVRTLGSGSTASTSRTSSSTAGRGSSSGKNIGEGDVDWPEVRRAFSEIGYDGWVTTEDARAATRPTSRTWSRASTASSGRPEAVCRLIRHRPCHPEELRSASGDEGSAVARRIPRDPSTGVPRDDTSLPRRPVFRRRRSGPFCHSEELRLAGRRGIRRPAGKPYAPVMIPPSIVSEVPVTQPDSSDARNSAARAMSSGTPAAS